MAFLGYEVNGILQQEPPEELTTRLEAAIRIELEIIEQE